MVRVLAEFVHGVITGVQTAGIPAFLPGPSLERGQMLQKCLCASPALALGEAS
ncbi:MAG: hypothetical protein M3186_04325 [Actinomycetota bacterium]|nr:hypothetical protein [Actinomycetota bacterium]